MKGFVQLLFHCAEASPSALHSFSPWFQCKEDKANDTNLIKIILLLVSYKMLDSYKEYIKGKIPAFENLQARNL